MQVEEIIEQAESFAGQVIDVEGHIQIVEREKRQIVFLASSDHAGEDDVRRILIAHTLAELKTIIRPLPSMQLMFRGVMIYPPYFYSFPAQFRATLTIDVDNTPILKDITWISLKVPYGGKTSEIVPYACYRYVSELDYTPVSLEDRQQAARATVRSQKDLLLVQEDVEAETISGDENRYARRIAKQIVRLSGWLAPVPSKNGIINHLLFFTSAIRASMVAVGPLREDTVIWIRPSELYRLLKVHIPLKRGQTLHQSLDIVGEVDYLQEADSPDIGVKTPKLVFTQIYRVIIHEQNYLL